MENTWKMKAGLLGGWLLTLVVGSFASDVFASSAHLKIVAEGEKRMLRTLRHYIQTEQSRLEEITEKVSKIEAVYMPPRFRSLDEHIGNPLNAFHLIKRFATVWKEVWQVASNFGHYENLRKEADSIAAFIPQEDDYRGALASIIRLQNIYLLSSEDLAQGIVGSLATIAPSDPLSQKACFDLAQAALGLGDQLRAQQWFGIARNNSRSPTVPTAWILYGLAQTEAARGDLLASSTFIEEAKVVDPANLPNISANDINPPRPEADWMIKYKELCRRAVQNKIQADDSLYCEIKASASNPIERYKMEWLNTDPQVALFHDFITDRESTEVVQMSKLLIQRAKVGRSTEAEVSNERIGKVAWLWSEQENPILRQIERRISQASGLDALFPAAEPLQASNYGMGGHYEPHFDHDEHRFSRAELAPEIVSSGDRIATFMIYLNNVTMGGATVFPKINLYSKPVKNAAIFWHNYHRAGRGDERTLHAGCPVLLGEKWVANKWIREFGQEFLRPCLTSPDM